MESPAGPSRLIIRIDWSDLDLFGHVNNVSFFRFMQSARVAYWERFGISSDFADTGIGPMLASASCNFRHPLFYPGSVHLETEASFVRRSSFGFRHRMYDDQGRLCAEAQDVMVYWDFRGNQSVPFPIAFRKAMEAGEGRPIPDQPPS